MYNLRHHFELSFILLAAVIMSPGASLAQGRSRPPAHTSPPPSAPAPSEPAPAPPQRSSPPPSLPSGGGSAANIFQKSAEGYAYRTNVPGSVNNNGNYYVPSYYPLYSPYYGMGDGYNQYAPYAPYTPSPSPSRSVKAYQNSELTQRELHSHPVLRRTIAEISDAWLHSNLGLLARHVMRNSSIDIYMNGEFRQKMTAEKYLSLTGAALKQMKTRSIELNQVYQVSSDTYDLVGVHTYTDKTQSAGKVNIRFRVQKVNGEYYITQAGASYGQQAP